MKQKNSPGIKEITQPKKTCQDKKCPFHGNLKVRGRVFEGTLTKLDVAGNATIEFLRLKYIPKYERYEKRTTKLHAHMPSCLEIEAGNQVKIGECRKLSKTKNFVVIGIKK
jgi:small subunit ribosomal protein S17